MFQYDSDALRLATRLISKGWDRSLGLAQRVFAYLVNIWRFPLIFVLIAL